MIARTFGLVVVTGLAVGLMIPGPGPKPAVQAGAAQLDVSRAAGAEEAGGQRRSSADVVLKRRANGHFYADVEVNGQTVEFLVDTGATAIALSGEDARKLGFDWNEFDLEPVGRGVSGAVNGKVVELHHLQLGRKEAWDLDAVIIPNGLEISLLGQNFLSQIGSVKISGDEMVLR